MDNQIKDKIQKLIDSSPVMVFMKGTKLMPQCGFSNNVVQILNSLGIEFSTFDVLSDCLDLQKQIEMEFEDLFNNYEKTDYIYSPKLDPSGKSKKHDVYFDFPKVVLFAN